jgi:hypothetical protein
LLSSGRDEGKWKNIGVEDVVKEGEKNIIS